MGKICRNCGAELDESTAFCATCGKKLSDVTPQSADEKLKPNADGKYYWYYELNMFTNPTVFITLMKIFGGIIFGMGIFLALIIGEDFTGAITFMLKFWLYGSAGFFVLVGFSYCVYALIQGGKYCVIFEMDKKSVTHIQTAKQFQKAQVISAIATVMGAVKGSLSLTGTGILAGCRSSMKTEFKYVDKIKVKRRRHVIYLHAALAWNQIYVSDENFDTVLEYILSSIPATAKRRGI